MTIPILNENLITICEKYGYNIPKANEQVLNRYIKLSSEEIPDELKIGEFPKFITMTSQIAAMSKKENDMW